MTMKTLLGIILLLAATVARGQVYSTLNIGTNVLVGGESTNANVAAVLDLSRATSVGFVLSCNSVSTNGSGDIVAKFQVSHDNAKWWTEPFQDLTLTAALDSTNTVYTWLGTNWDARAYRYIRLDSIENSTTNAVTNIVAKYFIK